MRRPRAGFVTPSPGGPGRAVRWHYDRLPSMAGRARTKGGESRPDPWASRALSPKVLVRFRIGPRFFFRGEDGVEPEGTAELCAGARMRRGTANGGVAGAETLAALQAWLCLPRRMAPSPLHIT